MYTYMHMCIQKNIQTYKHTNIQAYILTHMHTFMHSFYVYAILKMTE